MIGQLTGGLGREARKEASPAAAFTGEELPPDKVPLVRWLYGNSGGASGQSERFHERIRQASAADNEIKERVMEGVGVADYRTEHPGRDRARRAREPGRAPGTHTAQVTSRRRDRGRTRHGWAGSRCKSAEGGDDAWLQQGSVEDWVAAMVRPAYTVNETKRNLVDA